MIKYLSYLSFLLFFAQSVFAQVQFAKMEREQIEVYQAKIAHELRKNRCVQVGLAVTLLGTAGICAYKLLAGASPEASLLVSGTALGSSQEVSNAALKNALERSQKLINDQTRALKDAGVVADNRNWGSWLKSWARFFGQQYTLVFLSQIATDTLNPFTKYFKRFDAAVDGAIGKVFHDGNLNWFVTKHTSVFDLLTQLETAVANLSKYQEENEPLYASLWQLSVQQISSIVGFMQYKITQLEKESVENAKIAQSVVDKLTMLINETSDQLTIYAQKNEDVAVLSQRVVLIQKLRNQLEQVLFEFALVEAVTVY